MKNEVDTAFTDLYDKVWRRVWARIIAKCPSVSDASDVFQEVWTELYRIMLKRGSGYIKNGEAMAMHIASCKLFRYHLAREHTRQCVPPTVEGEDGNEIEIDDAALETLSAEEIAVDRMNLEKVRDYLAKQDDELRRIFLLRFQLDLSLNEIAGLLGVSRTRVGNRLYRTLEKLREMLKA